MLRNYSYFLLALFTTNNIYYENTDNSFSFTLTKIYYSILMMYQVLNTKANLPYNVHLAMAIN